MIIYHTYSLKSLFLKKLYTTVNYVNAIPIKTINFATVHHYIEF